MRRKAENKNYISNVMALAASGIFAVCVLAVLFTGAEAYETLTEQGRVSYENRTIVHFIEAKIRQADVAGGVMVEKFGNSDALVMPETIDGENYKTLIYCHNGWLMEYFAAENTLDTSYDMDFGNRLIPADSMVLCLKEDLLQAEVTVGGEKTTVMLFIHSGEERNYEE